MTRDVLDKELLDGLSPWAVRWHLQRAGWENSSSHHGFSVWRRELKAGLSEVVVPEDSSFADYTDRLEDVLLELQRVEHTSIQQLFDRIALVSADVTRLRRSGGDSMPFPLWSQLVEGVRKLFLAAACATVRPKAHFNGKKPNLAVGFMDSLRMGQTERGSYVLTVISDVSAEPISDEAKLIETEAVPFERRTLQTLVRSVAAANRAADEFLETESFSPFISAVGDGVSANLCDALVDVLGGGTSSVSLSVDWSETLGKPPGPSTVSVSPDKVAVFSHAKEELSRPVSYEDVPVQGFVSRLERPEGSDEGTVTIESGAPFTRVRVVLNAEEYDLAITAHRNEQRLFCEGAVEKSGQSWLMDAPKSVFLAK
jgi:hypothetical protein